MFYLNYSTERAASQSDQTTEPCFSFPSPSFIFKWSFAAQPHTSYPRHLHRVLRSLEWVVVERVNPCIRPLLPRVFSERVSLATRSASSHLPQRTSFRFQVSRNLSRPPPGSSRWTRTTSRGHEPRELPIAPPLRYNQGTLCSVFYSQNRCFKMSCCLCLFLYKYYIKIFKESQIFSGRDGRIRTRDLVVQVGLRRLESE